MAYTVHPGNDETDQDVDPIYEWQAIVNSDSSPIHNYESESYDSLDSFLSTFPEYHGLESDIPNYRYERY